MTERSPDPTTRKAVELLAAADAVASAERPRPPRRILGRRLKDPMATALMLLAIAVVALAYLVSVQGRDTATRSVRNNSSLQALTNTVRDLSAQVDALERASQAKDALNAELVHQNQELRDLLLKKGVNPTPLVGPPPTPSPTSSRSGAPAAPSNPKAPSPLVGSQPAALPPPPIFRAPPPPAPSPSPKPSPSPSPSPSPTPTPTPTPSHTPCTLVNPLSGKCLL